MIYPYQCRPCGHKFEVIKSVKHLDEPESCPSCKSADTLRYIARTYFYGARVEDAEWNPGLGEIVKSSRHRAELAKRKGLVEVGNESLDNIHRKFDGERDKKISTRYDDIVDTSLKTVSL